MVVLLHASSGIIMFYVKLYLTACTSIRCNLLMRTYVYCIACHVQYRSSNSTCINIIECGSVRDVGFAYTLIKAPLVSVWDELRHSLHFLTHLN